MPNTSSAPQISIIDCTRCGHELFRSQLNGEWLTTGTGAFHQDHALQRCTNDTAHAPSHLDTSEDSDG